MQRRQLLKAAAAPLALACMPAAVMAQSNWPKAKVITYMVPFAAGGTTDQLGRLIAQQLGPVLGTTVVVDNKAGAGGSVGSELASRTQPDGFTILGGTISAASSISEPRAMLTSVPSGPNASITAASTEWRVAAVAGADNTR